MQPYDPRLRTKSKLLAPRAARRQRLRLGPPGPGGPRPSPDLHRSGDLRRRDDATSSAHLGLSRARKPDSRQRRLHHRAGSGCGRSSCCGTSNGTIRALLQPLHPSRHHAVPHREGHGARLPVPVSRLEFPQHRQAARRAVAGRLCRRFQRSRNSTSRRCRGSTCYRGFIFGDAQSRRAAAARPSRADHAGRSTSGSTAIPSGKVVVCEANRHQVQGQLEARLRQFRRRLSRRCISHRSLLETENRSGRRRQQGHVLLQGLARQGADVHGLYGQRPSLQGQAAEHPEARRRPVGGRSAASPGREHYVEELRRRYGDEGRGNPRSRLLRAGEHQRVSELLAARQPHPGIRAGRGRRDQRHLVRHRDGGRGRHARRRGRPTSMRCACARRRQFPNFGEVDDVANFEQIQRGLACRRTSGSTCTAGSGFPGASRPIENGIITAPATDEAFMREYIKEWKRLMKAAPDTRGPAGAR